MLHTTTGHVQELSLCLGVIIGVLFGNPGLAQDTETSVNESGSSDIAFVITERTLAELRGHELSEEVLGQLETLQDTNFATEGLFLNALEEAIGAEALEQYQELILELAYVYDSADRREPFKPMVNTDDGKPQEPPLLVGDECPPPLGNYDLGQFRLLGIILEGKENRARIKAPDGESYTITAENCLGRFAGKVIRFSENCITIRESKRYEKDGEVTVKEDDTEICLNAEE
jgi:Tfp pilus assembly protein PilP